MGAHTPVEPDKEQVQEAESFWHDFMKLTNYVIYGIVIVLILLGLAFVDWA